MWLCICIITLLLKASAVTFSTIQDDTVLEGTWSYYHLMEEIGFWACPHVKEKYVSPRHWWRNFYIADYTPPEGKTLLSLFESLDILTAAVGASPFNVMYIGDSLSRQKFFAASCIAEKDSLPLQSAHIHSRFLTENPCGCLPENNTDTHYTSQELTRCEFKDAPSRWIYDESAHLVVLNGGAWFTQYYLGCLNAEELEIQHEKMLTDLIPYIMRYKNDGKIVMWFTLPHSVSARADYAHHTFKTRNEVARRVFSPIGMLFVDPYELMLTRIKHDPTVKCDELHFCGFGPKSPNVFEVQLILHFAAMSVSGNT
jgi:hypothetical protein